MLAHLSEHFLMQSKLCDARRVKSSRHVMFSKALDSPLVPVFTNNIRTLLL